jgi:hypothetical protein
MESCAQSWRQNVLLAAWMLILNLAGGVDFEFSWRQMQRAQMSRVHILYGAVFVLLGICGLLRARHV